MTLLKDNDYKEINVALLSLEADIKNKTTNFDTSVIDRQLAEINSRIDKINAGGNNSSAEINDIRTEIENINSKLRGNSAKIESIEQKLADIFSAENKVTDFNTTTNSGIYYWVEDTANKPTDYGVLLVNKFDSGNTTTGLWVNQIAYGTNGKIYFRQNINSGSWREWKAVAFDGEITAYKVANALTVNGKTYDGSSAVNAGVQTVENGGTGATDAKGAFVNLANGLSEGFAPLDTEYMIYKNTDGTNWGLYTLSHFWEYIKDKISSVLGLTGKKLTLQGGTVSSNSYTDTNPKLEFKNADGSQNISLTFTDYDAVQEPASLTLNGNQGNEYFIAPNIKATRNITLDSAEGSATSTYGLEPLTIGFPSGTYDGQSLGFDRNSIQAKRNGEVNVLYLNYHGGIVSVNEPNNSNGGLKVKQKMVIPIGAPSNLEDGCIWIS